MGELLEKIIEATEKRGEADFNRSLEDDELIRFKREFNEEEVSEEEELSDEDSFFLYVNKRLLRGVRAKLGQIYYQLEHFYPVEKVRFISRSLTNLVKAFNKSFESFEFLFSNLHNQDHLSLRASVFVIASIHDCPDAHFNKLLHYFAHCEDEYLNDYEKALNVALNPSISSRLLSILPFCAESVFEAGLRILSFRSDITIEDWKQLTSDKNNDFKYFGMLERVKLNDGNALEYIEKNESEKFLEERLRLLLINGKSEILDLCREKVKMCEVDNYHLRLLRIAGNKSDIINLTRLYKKSEPHIKKEIIETIGSFQCAESMDFFLNIVEEDENNNEIIFNEIFMFTSIDFLLEDSPVESFINWCDKELFRYRNDRIYKGEVWNHKSHIKALRDERNSGEDRLILWHELAARGGHIFNLNTSWSIDKQEEAITRLDNWFNENNNVLSNPWNYKVK